MALTKKLPQVTGPAEYWRIENTNINFSTKYALITLAGYLNEGQADQGKTRGTIQVEVRSEKFDDFFQRTGDQMKMAYAAVVALEPNLADSIKA